MEWLHSGKNPNKVLDIENTFHIFNQIKKKLKIVNLNEF